MSRKRFGPKHDLVKYLGAFDSSTAFVKSSGGQVVSVLAFYSDDPSSTAFVNCFIVK